MKSIARDAYTSVSRDEHLPPHLVRLVPACPTPVTAHAPIVTERSDGDPLGRILRAYDRAIFACESFNETTARHSIRLLRSALDLDTPAARSFDALYAWCETTVIARDFVGPARCLRALRAAWCRAEQPHGLSPRADLPVC